jgi:hypothetical protein
MLQIVEETNSSLLEKYWLETDSLQKRENLSNNTRKQRATSKWLSYFNSAVSLRSSSYCNCLWMLQIFDSTKEQISEQVCWNDNVINTYTESCQDYGSFMKNISKKEEESYISISNTIYEYVNSENILDIFNVLNNVWETHKSNSKRYLAKYISRMLWYYTH